MTVFVFLLVKPDFYTIVFFFLPAFVDGLSKYSSPSLRLLSAIRYGWFRTLINLIMMFQRKGKKKKKKVSSHLAFVQMFFSFFAFGKHTYIKDRKTTRLNPSPQPQSMLPFSSISCWPWMKVFALLNISALGKWTLTSLEQRKVSIPTFRPLFFFKRFLLLCCQVFTLIVHVSCFCKQQKCWNMCEG